MRDNRDVHITVFDLIDEAYYRADNDGRLTAVSESAARLMGYDSVDAVLGLPLESWWDHPEERQNYLQTIQGQGSVRGFEVTLRKKDGNSLRVKTSAHYYYDDDGNVMGTEGVWRDVPEQDAVQAALAESEQRYRSLFDAASSALFLVADETGKIVDANSAASSAYGYSYDELLQLNFSDLASELTPPTSEHGSDTGEHPLRYHKRKDGTEFPVEVANEARFCERSGKAISLVVIYDVTQRVNAERAAIESESKYRSIFEATGSPYFMADAETGQILDANAAGCRQYGYSYEEILQLRDTDLSADPETTRQARDSRLTHVPLRYHKRKDGSVFPIEAHLSYYRWNGRDVILTSIHDITDRVESELALKESESKYRSIFEATGSPFFLADMETGRVLDANQAACRQYGYSYEEILKLRDVDVSADPELTLQVRHGRPEHVPFRYHKRKDGSVFPMEVYLSYYKWQGRDVVLAAVNDISERVEYETALRESEARYRGIVESQTDIVLRYDLSGRLTFANDAHARITGEPSIEGQDRSDLSLVHPDDRQMVRDALDAMMKPPYRNRVRARLKTVDGWRWYSYENYLIRDKDGNPLEGQTVGRDIHNGRVAQEQMQTHARRLSVATEAASEAIWEYEIATGNLYVGPQAYAILEYPEGESIDYASAIYPDDLRVFAEQVQNHLSGKIDRIDQDYRVTTKNGRQVWIHNRGRITQRDEQGRPLAIGGTITDVTEARNSKEAIEKAHADLQQAYRAQKEFLDCVTHEVRTPLIAVKGYADVLMEGFAGPLTEHQVECLKKIQSSSDSLLGGLTAMLEMSRIKGGKVDISYEIFSPVKLVSRVASTVAPQARQKGLSMQIHDTDCRCAGVTDAKKVSVILTNILSNAIKFTDEGSIDLFVDCDETGFSVAVVDTGKGMEPSEIEMIFEEFTQLKTSIKYKETGFGIGLALVAALVDVMDAQLTVSSIKGVGSAFTLRVPRLDPSAAAELDCCCSE